VANNFALSATEAIAAGQKVGPGWYASSSDPAVAQYWNGSEWVGNSRSYESLNNAALQEMLALLAIHSTAQQAIMKNIRTNTTILALLALLSAFGGFILGITITSNLSG